MLPVGIIPALMVCFIRLIGFFKNALVAYTAPKRRHKKPI